MGMAAYGATQFLTGLIGAKTAGDRANRDAIETKLMQEKAFGYDQLNKLDISKPEQAEAANTIKEHMKNIDAYMARHAIGQPAAIQESVEAAGPPTESGQRPAGGTRTSKPKGGGVGDFFSSMIIPKRYEPIPRLDWMKLVGVNPAAEKAKAIAAGISKVHGTVTAPVPTPAASFAPPVIGYAMGKPPMERPATGKEQWDRWDLPETRMLKSMLGTTAEGRGALAAIEPRKPEAEKEEKLLTPDQRVMAALDDARQRGVPEADVYNDPAVKRAVADKNLISPPSQPQKSQLTLWLEGGKEGEPKRTVDGYIDMLARVQANAAFARMDRQERERKQRFYANANAQKDAQLRSLMREMEPQFDWNGKQLPPKLTPQDFRMRWQQIQTGYESDLAGMDIPVTPVPITQEMADIHLGLKKPEAAAGGAAGTPAPPGTPAPAATATPPAATPKPVAAPGVTSITSKKKEKEDPGIRAYADKYFKGDYQAAVKEIQRQKALKKTGT